MNYEIRNCLRKDLPRVIQLCKLHAKFERAAYQSTGKTERLRKALFGKNPVLFCWVVEIEGKVVGYTTFTFDYSTWDASRFLYMDCLFVEQEFRGLGIGEQIMGELLQHARLKKCVNIQWQTPEFNKRAIKFYRRMGASNKFKVRFNLSCV